MKAITELANLRDARLVKGRIEVNVLNHLDANQWFCTRYSIKNQNLKIHIRTENLTLCYISFQVPTCSTIFPIKTKVVIMPAEHIQIRKANKPLTKS